MAYHWLAPGFDFGGTGANQVFPDLDAVIPAGATLKRFLLRNCHFYCNDGGDAFNKLIQRYITFDVNIVAGQYSPRQLYKTSRTIPFEVAAFHDVLTAQRLYSGYHHAGDLELAFNQRCAFGKNTGAAFTVRLSTSMNTYPGALNIGTFRLAVTFMLLYQD